MVGQACSLSLRTTNGLFDLSRGELSKSSKAANIDVPCRQPKTHLTIGVPYRESQPPQNTHRRAHDLSQRARGQEALASALANPRTHGAGQRIAGCAERPSALARKLGQQRMVDGQGWPLILTRQAPVRYGGSHRQPQGTQSTGTCLPEKAPAAQMDEQMKLSLHQHIALFWLIGAPGVFAPVMENAKRPDAG